MDHVVPVVTSGPARRRGRLAGLLIGLCGALCVPAGESLAQVAQQSLFTSPEPPEWVESPVVLPQELPAESALAPFVVSQAATASFLIDTSSVTRGDDGIWRFAQGVAGAELGSFGGALTLRPSGLWPDAQTPLEGVLQANVAKLSNWGVWVPAGWRVGGARRAEVARFAVRYFVPSKVPRPLNASKPDTAVCPNSRKAPSTNSARRALTGEAVARSSSSYPT